MAAAPIAEKDFQTRFTNLLELVYADFFNNTYGQFDALILDADELSPEDIEVYLEGMLDKITNVSPFLFLGALMLNGIELSEAERVELANIFFDPTRKGAASKTEEHPIANFADHVDTVLTEAMFATLHPDISAVTDAGDESPDFTQWKADFLRRISDTMIAAFCAATPEAVHANTYARHYIHTFNGYGKTHIDLNPAQLFIKPIVLSNEKFRTTLSRAGSSRSPVRTHANPAGGAGSITGHVTDGAPVSPHPTGSNPSSEPTATGDNPTPRPLKPANLGSAAGGAGAGAAGIDVTDDKAGVSVAAVKPPSSHPGHHRLFGVSHARVHPMNSDGSVTVIEASETGCCSWWSTRKTAEAAAEAKYLAADNSGKTG